MFINIETIQNYSYTNCALTQSASSLSLITAYKVCVLGLFTFQMKNDVIVQRCKHEARL